MWIGARQNLGDKVRKPVVRAAGRPVGDMIFGPITSTFPPHPTSAGRARALVRGALDGYDGAVLDDIVLMVSELVTNAMQHALSEITMVLQAHDGVVRVEVIDRSAAVPALLGVGSPARSGRGMQVVDRLADAWGVLPRHSGKAVWFEVSPRASR